jgi:hypothetical protein
MSHICTHFAAPRPHPLPPLRLAAVANPLDEDCEKEGQVVCHQGRIKGERGEALRPRPPPHQGPVLHMLTSPLGAHLQHFNPLPPRVSPPPKNPNLERSPPLLPPLPP